MSLLPHMKNSKFAHWLPWAAFLIAYIVLDWASYLHPLHGLNITPWNPSVALGLVFWLRYGRIAAIPWFAAMLLGDILVRGLPAPLLPMIVSSGSLILGYGIIAEVLRQRLSVGAVPTDQRQLLAWLATVVAGTLVTSCWYIFLLVGFDLIPKGDWMIALSRFWVGDFVGVIVTMPFFWMLMVERERLQENLLRWETAGYGLLAAVMLWIAFGLGGSGEFQYFYLLFLPLVLAAARQGMAGAAIAAFILQAGIMVAVQWMNLVAVTVFELQMLGAVLAFVGLFIGVVIDEKQRMSEELRQTLRLAAAGEMAGALAHELNQPLTALTAYGMASEQLLEQGETGERLRDTIRRMVSESFRAAEVVRRLRDFFRTGSTRLETMALGDLLESATAPFVQKAQQQAIELIIEPAPDCTLLADRLQLEVVLRNLLANAFDAVTEHSSAQRQVCVSARLENNGRVCIVVEDSGPGLSRAAASKLFEAFQSTKTSGLGLGLAISRAITEAHGGSLKAELADHGLFKLSLPTEERTHHAA